MADTKVTALTEDTSVASTDLGYTVEDPGGTPVGKKATWLNILKGAALGVLTADGDIFYRASGALTRLAKGTAGQVLTMNAGATAPEWAAAAGGTPTVQVSHPTDGATRANTAFGSLSTAWTDSITIASGEDVQWDVDICYELSSATSTWFFALYVDGTMYDRIQVLYTSAASGRPYHFKAGGVVEGLSAASHTFEVKISTYASNTFTIRDTLDTASAGDSLTATGRSSMRLRPVLAA